MALGYEGELYILAFDHRGSFKKQFGISGSPSEEELARLRDGKRLIFEGFKRAIEEGAPSGGAGVLADEEYGGDVAREASKEGYVFAMPVEKSGQDEFDFEYGDEFGKHIEDFDPTFSKVLVRYNPEGDAGMNERQTARLKELGDWLHANDRKYLFELLVPATDEQLAGVGGDSDRYDVEVRPGLMIETIKALQAGGVEPDIWKIEGIDKREDCRRISEAVRADGRDGVACVVLGRGADNAAVEHWLKQGAGVPGYVGFAIGRTIWSDAVKGFANGSIDRDAAAKLISDNYRHFIEVYRSAS